MKTTPKKNKGLVTGLGVLQVLIGLGAVGGGLGLILDTSGSNLGMPLEMLKRTPFSTFLVPGIVLLIVCLAPGKGFSHIHFAEKVEVRYSLLAPRHTLRDYLAHPGERNLSVFRQNTFNLWRFTDLRD